MIIGTKENIKTYKGLNPRIDMAIDFVLNLDENIEPGCYHLDGDNVYANVGEGEAKILGKEFDFEVHKEYLDLHYIVKGKELMVYAPKSTLSPTMEFNEEKDYMLLRGEGKELLFNEGEFYLVHPFDAHAPGYGYEKAGFKKVILKIRV